ncbi:MAG: type II secretion system F family protein [Pyrobaculum sp.]
MDDSKSLFFHLYLQSGLAFSYRKYVFLLVALPLTVGAAVGVSALFLLGPPAAAALGIPAGLLTFAGLVAYPLHLVSARRSHFDNFFVYTLSVMLPLFAAGVPLGRVVARMAEVEEDKYIARELALATREMVVMGASPHEALAHSAERVPSQAYKETVNLLARASKITERVDLVLLARLEWLLRAKQIKAQSLVRSLALLFEIYVVVTMLMPILVFIVALALSPLGALDVGGISLDPVTLMTLVGLVYSPLVGVVFYIIFNTTASI